MNSSTDEEEDSGARTPTSNFKSPRIDQAATQESEGATSTSTFLSPRSRSDELASPAESPRPNGASPRPNGPASPARSPRANAAASPASRGKVVKRKVRRRKKGGTITRSRSASTVGPDEIKITERSSSSVEGTAVIDIDIEVEKPVAKNVSERNAFACPACSVKLESNLELTRHMRTHEDAPFPGIPVRNRESMVMAASPLAPITTGGGNGNGNGGNMGSTQLAPVQLPPLAIYLSPNYFTWK